uniref:Uncharacterized protein n=1 Tax=Strigamia maritima TaxID=126957 RepID=T1J1A5_STRMM
MINERKTIVQLFEWKWRDIVNECEQLLSCRISYKLQSRGSSEQEFQNMVERCNKLYLKPYDVVKI